MLARSRAGDVEQPAFRFVDVIEFRFVGGIGDAFVSGRMPSSQAITTTARDSRPLARLMGAVVISFSPVRRPMAA
jgi:hypothetical protein